MSELQTKIDGIVSAIEKIKSKENKIYFFVQDTKNNPKGSVAYVYELCKILHESGYQTAILHDDDYKKMEWLGEEYTSLPHVNIKKNFMVATHDMIILPEILAYIMEQLVNIPCMKVVLCQSYDWIFETLEAGATWTDFGFDKCITVSDELFEYINSFFPSVKINTVNPFVHESVKPPVLPSRPVIAISAREQRDALKIIKAFYTKYPNFRWFGFRDLRGLNRKDYIAALNQSCLSVWIDDKASFGTFPLESMTCKIPVIGKVPAKVPEWMTDQNGVWVSDETEIIDQIAKYLQHWIEDSIPDSIFEKMEETIKKYSREQTKHQIIKAIDFYVEKRFEALNNALTKLKLTEYESETIHDSTSNQ